MTRSDVTAHVRALCVKASGDTAQYHLVSPTTEARFASPKHNCDPLGDVGLCGRLDPTQKFPRVHHRKDLVPGAICKYCLAIEAASESNDVGNSANRCRCGNRLDDGEGYDGNCGDCADRREARALEKPDVKASDAPIVAPCAAALLASGGAGSTEALSPVNMEYNLRHGR